jgi:hypothetical protein
MCDCCFGRRSRGSRGSARAEEENEWRLVEEELKELKPLARERTHTRTHGSSAVVTDHPTNGHTLSGSRVGAKKKLDKYAHRRSEKSVICRPWNRDTAANTEALERLYENQRS